MRYTLILLAFLVGLVIPRPAAVAQTPDPCAPTPTPTATETATPTHTPVPPTATPTPLPGAVTTIYSSGWGQGWGLTTPGGWRGSYTITSITEGANLQVVYGGYGGLQVYRIPAQDIPAGAALAFTLSGTGRVRVTVDHAAGTFSGGTVGVGNVRIPLPALNGLSRITFQNDENAARTLTFTDLRIEGAGAAPSSTPTPTATPPAATPAPSAVPPGGIVRILPLGDSITEGVNGGYRDVLQARLRAAGVTYDMVGPRVDAFAAGPDRDHAGTPGYNTGDVLRELPGYLSTYHPTVVLLMIGTNDLAWWTADPNAPANTAANVGHIIDQAQAAGATVILATTPPISPGNVEPLDRNRADLIRVYNTELRSLAQARGLTLVDVEAALALGDLYDGIHPTEVVHDTKIAPLFAAALGV